MPNYISLRRSYIYIYIYRERERERERENVLRKGERKAKGERTSLAREREKQFLYNFLMIWR